MCSVGHWVLLNKTVIISLWFYDRALIVSFQQVAIYESPGLFIKLSLSVLFFFKAFIILYDILSSD